MEGRKLFGTNGDLGENGEVDGAPLGGTRAEAIQRLQVGLFGLFSMILVVGVANIVYNRAQQTEDQSVPDAAPTTEPTPALPQSDPLADAGVVPDIPVDPEPEAAPEGEVTNDGQANEVPDVPVTEDTNVDPTRDAVKTP
ncbi:MAG: hypothetical protein AAF250_13460 [Pseudomonadota bacterium]